MRRRPRISKRTRTLVPYTTLCRSEDLAQTFFARLLGSKTAAQTDDEDCSKLLLGSELEQAMAQDAQIPSEPLHSSGRRSSGPSGVLRRLESRVRSEEHTSELQSLMRISYAVFCLKKKT